MTPGKRATRARRKTRMSGALAERRAIVEYIKKHASSCDDGAFDWLVDQLERGEHHVKEDDHATQ